MNLCNIRRTFLELRPKRKWKIIYWMVDVHGVIIPGSWHRENNFQFISQDCEEVLKWISNKNDQKLILWTSSYYEEVNKLGDWLFSRGIVVDFVNTNTDEKNTEYADFSVKPYFNILVDDKSGMEPDTDWLLIGKTLEDITGDSIIEWDNEKRARAIQGVESMKKYLSDIVVFRDVVDCP